MPFTIEARIKRSLRKSLAKAGFVHTPTGGLAPSDSSKETVRALHHEQRLSLLRDERDFIEGQWPKLSRYFANGCDIMPESIDPALEIVASGTWQSSLFRLASLLWTIPVSKGYGRRLRFLVWDESNRKLMGLIALGDPVFNLRVRDDVIGWTSEQRKAKLVNVMDAYVLGAIPPYNALLCGKLVACLVRSTEIRDIFLEKYFNKRGIISGKEKNAKYIAVTTSSALGRSSVYNRLNLNGTKYFRPIGYTSGWGHFHVSDSLFGLMRRYLELRKDSYANNNKFGQGPNWRLRAIRQTMSMLHMNPNLLRHGIQREVYLCDVASNAKRYLLGKVHRAQYRDLLSAKAISQAALNRWVIPRAQRNLEFRIWEKNSVLFLLRGGSLKVSKQVTIGKEVHDHGSR